MFKPDAEGTGVIINKKGVVIELNEEELLDFLRGLEYGFVGRFDKPAKTFGEVHVAPVDVGRPMPRLVDQQYLEQIGANKGESPKNSGD